jgi:predicted ATPase/class 3 adenylate cyclase
MSERDQLEQAIAALDSQRAILGDAVVDAALGPMREKLATLQLPSTEQQRKQVTILFADLAGFTAMSDTMDAEDVSDTMNALWHQLDTVITDHGGMIDKHIGDAIMALWGAQAAREDDPERAIRAALAMQAALATFRNMHAVTLQLRIGINTGLVLLGTVGTTHEFTAMGDPVNLASRLEHVAPVGGILISHNTYRHVRGLFDIQVLEPISVKGKATPIQVYHIVRAKPRSLALGTRGVEGIETHMIGRDADFLCLQQAVRSLIADRELQVVTVLGEAGLGKSRLLYELRSWIELLPEAIKLFMGRATQEMMRLPYALLRDVFAFRFDIQESDPAQVAREKLVTGVVTILGADHPTALLNAQLLGHLLGFDFSASPLLAGILDDPRQLRHRALLAFNELFTVFSQHEAILFVLEDLHWADEDSLEALAALTEHDSIMPMLMLAFARPTLLERRPGWGEGQTKHTRLILQPLSISDSRRLVEDILRHLPIIPPAVQELIVGGADGNPFYVEELIKMLIEQRVIVPGATAWRIAEDRLARVQVPPTLTGVLQARLDGLPADERTTLQQASVIGRVFWDQAVDQLRETSDEPAYGLLEDLRRRELVHRHETSAFSTSTEYLFKHALLREVTYETLLKRQRRPYHAQAAAWLLAASGDRVEAYAELIAEHYDLAGMAETAAEWYLRAGQHAQAAYANDSALLAYTKARELLLVGAQARVLFHLGSLYEMVGRWEDAEACYQTALAEATIDPLIQARVQRGYGRLLRLRSDFSPALTWFAQAQEMFCTLGNRLEETRTAAEMGVVYWLQGNYEAATQTLEASLAVARDLHDDPTMAGILRHLGTVALLQSRYGLALTHYQESVAVAWRLGDKYKLAHAINNMGILAFHEGTYSLAQQHFTEALALAREAGDMEQIAGCLSNLGEIAYEHDQLADAEQYLTEALVLTQRLGAKRLIAQAVHNLGLLAYRRTDYGDARTLLDDSMARYRELGMREQMAEVGNSLGLLTLAAGNLPVAQTHYREALANAQETGESREMAKAMVGIAAGFMAESAPPAYVRGTVQLLAATSTLLTTTTNTLPRAHRELYDQTLASAKALLDAAMFAVDWSAGAALPREAVLALAHGNDGLV